MNEKNNNNISGHTVEQVVGEWLVRIHNKEGIEHDERKMKSEMRLIFDGIEKRKRKYKIKINN